MAEGRVLVQGQPIIRRVKAALAVPWNYHVKRWLKQAYHALALRHGPTKAETIAREFAPSVPLRAGDRVRVRPYSEISSTLDPFRELKGCAFLEEMSQYCGTYQRVFKVMERFLDERDYKVKKVRGIILLEDVMCQGTPAFGPCDRCCLLFWREDWLEKIAETESDTLGVER